MLPPISTRARVAVGLALARSGMPVNKAAKASEDFFIHLRALGFDVVHKDWVDGPVKADPLTWDRMAEMAQTVEEEFGRKPWLP